MSTPHVELDNFDFMCLTFHILIVAYQEVVDSLRSNVKVMRKSDSTNQRRFRVDVVAMTLDVCY